MARRKWDPIRKVFVEVEDPAKTSATTEIKPNEVKQEAPTVNWEEQNGKPTPVVTTGEQKVGQLGINAEAINTPDAQTLQPRTVATGLTTGADGTIANANGAPLQAQTKEELDKQAQNELDAMTPEQRKAMEERVAEYNNRLALEKQQADDVAKQKEQEDKANAEYAQRREQLKNVLHSKYGDKYDELLDDPNTSPAIINALEKYDEAKKSAPTEKQKKAREIYDIINSGTAALSQLGTAIGIAKNASTGPVGGAVKAPDLMKTPEEEADKAKKRYDDATKALGDARDKLGDAIVNAQAYQYKTKKERDAADLAKQKADRDYELAKQKADMEWAKFVAENSRKSALAEKQMQELDSRIKKNDATARKANAEHKGSFVSLRFGEDPETGKGGKDLWISKDKWSPENIAKAFKYLSDDAKKAVYDYATRGKAENKRSFLMGGGKPVELNISVKDMELQEQMRFAIGQWLDKEGCEKALEFVTGLMDDVPYVPGGESRDFTNGGQGTANNKHFD